MSRTVELWSSPLITLGLLAAWQHCASGQTPSIASGGIINAASFIVGGPIAQGSFFSIFGINLGPPAPGATATSYPLQTRLGGVSVSVSDGRGTTVQAIPVFVRQDQINAIMPSNAPIGTVQITVNFNGVTSAAQSATVVAGAFGIFAVSNGRGPGIVQNALASGARPLNTSAVTAAPNSYVVVWGTGLGPLSSSLTCSGATIPDQCSPTTTFKPQVSSIQVFVGGVQVNLQDPFAYAARGPGFAGVDQVQFPLPPNAPLGCYVPVQVVVNGNAYSNTVTMAINTGGQPCVDDVPASRFARDGGKNSIVTLTRLNLSDTTDPTLTGSLDLGAAQFIRQPAGGALGFDVNAAAPPLGTCTYYNNVDLSGLLSGQLPLPAGATILNAGSAISVRGAKGTQTLTQADANSSYVGLLGGALAIPPTPFLDPGTFTISGTGGRDVGAFSFNLNIGAPATLLTQITSIDRSKPLVVNWSGGSSATQAIFIAGFASNPDKKQNGNFQCRVPAGASTFTIPTGMLANLPATTPGGNALGIFLFLTGPLGNQYTNFTTSSPALDHGTAFYATGYLINNVAFR